MSEGNFETKTTSGSETYTITSTQTKDSLTQVIQDISITSDYSETFIFSEDGEFTITINSNNYFGLDELKSTTTGEWEFLSSEGDYKNKERVKLILESSTSTFMGNTTTIDYTDNNTTTSYMIQLTRLSKDELNFDFTSTIQDETINSEIEGSKKFVEK